MPTAAWQNYVDSI